MTLTLIVAAGLVLVVTLSQDGERLLRRVREAFDLAHLPVNVAANQMGIHWSHLVRGLSGEKHLSISRMADLPVEFWQWFAVLIAVDKGTPKELDIQPRMAKAVLAQTHRERKRSGGAA